MPVPRGTMVKHLVHGPVTVCMYVIGCRFIPAVPCISHPYTIHQLQMGSWLWLGMGKTSIYLPSTDVEMGSLPPKLLLSGGGMGDHPTSTCSVLVVRF